MKKFLVLFLLISLDVYASWLSTYRELTDPIWEESSWFNESNVPQVPFSRDFEELQVNYGNENMYLIYDQMTDDDIALNNSNLERILNEELARNLVGEDLRILSRSQVRRIYRATEKERVVRDQHKYDPDEVLGLCFGRAIVAHMHALVRGVDDTATKKIWVLGDMKQWQFHVATMLKTKRGWYVVDTYTGLLSFDRWKRRMERDRKRNARPLMYFATDASRFGFLSNHIYSTILLFNYTFDEVENYVEDYRAKRSEDFYQGFFVDFFRSLDSNIDNIREF